MDKGNDDKKGTKQPKKKDTYLPSNTKVNAQLVQQKQKLDKALQSMWDYVGVSRKLN